MKKMGFSPANSSVSMPGQTFFTRACNHVDGGKAGFRKQEIKFSGNAF